MSNAVGPSYSEGTAQLPTAYLACPHAPSSMQEYEHTHMQIKLGMLGAARQTANARPAAVNLEPGRNFQRETKVEIEIARARASLCRCSAWPRSMSQGHPGGLPRRGCRWADGGFQYAPAHIHGCCCTRVHRHPVYVQLVKEEARVNGCGVKYACMVTTQLVPYPVLGYRTEWPCMHLTCGACTGASIERMAMHKWCMRPNSLAHSYDGRAYGHGAAAYDSPRW
eukprot:356496-Chlamydomonas_euryale.AAC.4